MSKTEPLTRTRIIADAYGWKDWWGVHAIEELVATKGSEPIRDCIPDIVALVNEARRQAIREAKR